MSNEVNVLRYITALVHMYPLGGSFHPNEYNKMAVFRLTKK